MLVSGFSNVTMALSKQDFTWILYEECLDFFRDRYFFSESNNYCFDRAAQEQLSKCSWRYTVTALRTP